MVKKKAIYPNRKKKDEVNKKAMIWVGSIVLGIIVVLSLLVVFNT